MGNMAVFERPRFSTQHVRDATSAIKGSSVSGPRFAWAILGGLLGITALAGLWIVLLAFVRLPARVLPDFSKYPSTAVAAVIVMACLVSSLPEEAAFTGYFQSFLEQKRSGPLPVAIAAVAMMPAHCLTQGFVWPVVLFYFLVDSMLGTIALLTKSIHTRNCRSFCRFAHVFYVDLAL